MERPGWGDFREQVSPAIREPRLSNGWTAIPKAIAGRTALLGVHDDLGRQRCNVALSAEPVETNGHWQPIEIDGLTGWWRRDFEDIAGTRPVTNVIAHRDTLWACAAGYDDATTLTAILAEVLA